MLLCTALQKVGLMSMDFEEMRKLQRKERSASAVVELSDEYYNGLSSFIKSATESYKNSQNNVEFRTLDNVVGLARDVFDKREQKILMKALHSSRSGEHDIAHLTSHEEKLYWDLVNALKANRQFFSAVLIGGYKPPKKAEKKTGSLINSSSHKLVIVRVIKGIPRFVGSDSQEHGPFKPDEVVKLSDDDAKLLTKQKLIEIV